MKRITPPKCTCCDHHFAVRESERWPSVKLCVVCHDKVLIFFATQMPHLLDGNPLAVDLLRVDNVELWRQWTMDRLNDQGREKCSRLLK